MSTYIQTLRHAGVGVVIDVRETPWSYKRAFCKSALSSELAKAGIDYVHVRSAGNPKENRRTAPTREECLRRYRELLRNNPEGVADLVAQIKSAAKRKKRVCLTCFEKEPHECHRSVLTSALRRKLGALVPVHLQALAKEKIGPLWIPQSHDHKTVRI